LAGPFVEAFRPLLLHHGKPALTATALSPVDRITATSTFKYPSKKPSLRRTTQQLSSEPGCPRRINAVGIRWDLPEILLRFETKIESCFPESAAPRARLHHRRPLASLRLQRFQRSRQPNSTVGPPLIGSRPSPAAISRPYAQFRPVRHPFAPFQPVAEGRCRLGRRLLRQLAARITSLVGGP
jgi:hypothetical protein